MEKFDYFCQGQVKTSGKRIFLVKEKSGNFGLNPILLDYIAQHSKYSLHEKDMVKNLWLV